MTDRSAETTATRSPKAPTQPPPGYGARGKSDASGTAAPAKPARPAPEAKRPPAPKKPPRRARLRLTRIDPWSVMKTSFLLSIAVGIVTVVAVAIVWTVLGAAGVWSSIDSTVTDVVGENGSTFSIEDYLGMSRVMGFTMIIAVIDVVLATALATLGAFIYNISAGFVGGVELTLAEDE